MQMSRLEINVRRLLTRCELIAKDDPHQDWKLEKYILALDDMMNKLQTLPNKPSKDSIVGYTKRIDFLKGVINAMKLSNPVERVAAAQLLSKNSTLVNDSASTNITTQIHQKTIAKYNRELRGELFHADKGINKDGVRQRLSNSNIQDEDLDAILKYNRNIQEKIAENMLSMTSNMKEHALAASAIIKKDINTLERSDKLTDINAVKLKKESLKLEEHTNSKWRCWVWIMIAFVLVVFFSKVKVVRALCKYTAQHANELSFDEGDLLYVYDKDVDPNWWTAKCGNQKGLIPVAYVEEQTQEIELPLHDAARRGNISFLREYLKQGISGTGLDAAGNTPLYWAARTGHVECAKELLNLPNPAVNAQNKMGDTPLHVAASHGHLEVINLLLEHNVDVLLRNKDGFIAEELASDASIKNAIQSQQSGYDGRHEYDDDDYNDDSD
ncbi:vesicle transport protein USE1-like isoform X2 [Odontomachus brunneus]|uniref:vesicle transport protein USE1-like isoform X2 n=1 Tax=Odontomachus brunneus TaxID=486640 RepID=UPI0013F2850B|nr:vesicle transport protein USE1-like isoform X2 [Odontomachus brunneus]